MRSLSTRRHRKLYRLIVVILLCLLLAIGAAIGYLYVSKKWIFAPQTSPTSQQTIEKQKEAEQSLENKSKDTYLHQTNGVDNPGVEVPIASTSDSIRILPEQSGQSVIIRTQLFEYPSGTCSLSIENGSKTYRSEADILYQSEYSTCQGFSVPLSELGSGRWTISIKATPVGGLSNINTTSFEVK